MEKIKNEILRIERIRKGEIMRREWKILMQLEDERKIEKERKEKLNRRIDCENLAWESVENAFSESEKNERIEKVRKREVEWADRRKEKVRKDRLLKDRRILTLDGDHVYRKRKKCGRYKYKEGKEKIIVERR